MKNKNYYFLLFFALLFSFYQQANATTCYPATSGGSISADQTGCAPFDPAKINSVNSASGGSGTLYYQWQYKSASTNGVWTNISNAMNSSYDPAALNETTYFKRLARREYCTTYNVSSNEICVVVNNCCNATISSLIIYDINNNNTYATLTNGASYTLSQLPANWNIEAILGGTSGESVSFSITGTSSSSNIENTYPFRTPTDLVSLNLGVGTYTITASVFSQDNCGGIKCDEKIISFSIVEPVCTGVINNLVVYNLGTSAPAFNLTNGATYNQNLFPSNWNIEAATSGNGESVVFTVSGSSTSTNVENTIPYRLPTDLATLNWGPGTYTINVRLFSLDNCGGTKCDEKTITITITGCPKSYAVSNYNVLGNIIDPNNGLGAADGLGVKFNRGDNGTYTRMVWDMGTNIPAGTLICARIKLEHCSNSTAGISRFKFWNAPAGTPTNGTYISQSAVLTTTSTSYQLFCFTTTTTCRYVKITDEFGCAFRVDNIEWSNCPPPAVTLTKTNATCGQNNGAITATATGGTSPFSYLWNTGATTAAINNLAAGTYTVTVTDANSLTATANTTVTQSGATLSYAVSNYNVLGNIIDPNNGLGAPDGLGVKFNRGDAGPYTRMVWDMGTNIPAGTVVCARIKLEHCSNSSAGISRFKFWNAPAGTPTNGTYIAQSGVLTTTSSSYQLYCFTTTAICRYVKITDETGCAFRVDNIEWSFCNPPSVTVSGSNAYCGLNNGSVNAVVSGGAAPYTYLWSNSATSATVNNIGAGTFTVTVTDNNGLTASGNVTITQLGSPTAVASITQPITCFGGLGAAQVVASNGTPGYTYLWSTGATTAQVSNLSAGTYTVTVTDAKGCTVVKAVTLQQPTQLVANITSVIPVTCYGENTGSATVTASGGTPAYTYLWNNGATPNTISNVPAGNYSVTVTDANGCTANVNTTITEPQSALNAQASGSTAYCNNPNGSANVVASGGTPAYTYLWNNGATTASINNLAAGTYTATVTDANGCVVVRNAVVGNTNSVINVDAFVTSHVTVFGGNDGAADVTASGGNSPYTYLWSTGATTQAIGNLVAGTYTVTVTDANGCTNTDLVVITQPTQLTVTVTGEDAYCNQSNGSVTASANGGVAPYSYLWNTGATTATVNGLAAGTYTVTATDNNGATASGNVTITQLGSPTAVASITQPITCFGGLGAAQVVASNGTPGYTYLWSTGATTAQVSNLSAGMYTVTVTDSKGCTVVKWVNLTQPAPLTVVVNPVNGNCNNGNVGSACAVVTGGQGTISYLWNNSETTACISNLGQGIYEVTVTDGICTSSGSALVEVIGCCNVIDGGIIGYNESNCGPFDPAAMVNLVSPTGGYGTIEYRWYFRNASNPSWTIIVGAVSDSYDPTLISETTHYKRAAKRSGCPDFIAECNTITKTVYTVPVISNLPVLGQVCDTVTSGIALTGATPAGGTYSGHGVTNNVFYPSVAGLGTHVITYSYISADNCPASATTSVTVVSCVCLPPATPQVTGIAVVCSGTNQVTYTAVGATGATAYNWTFMNGITIVNGQGTASITVNFSTQSWSSNICVVASNSCGSSQQACLYVNVIKQVPALTGTISGQKEGVCPGSVLQYCIPAAANTDNYVWTVPANSQIISGAGTNCITVQFNTGFTSGNITVKGQNCKGFSGSKSITVRKLPFTTNAILSGPLNVCKNTYGVQYCISGILGATTYTWTVPTGATITNGQGTSCITVDFGSSYTKGSLVVVAGNGCGSTSKSYSIYSTPNQPSVISGLTTNLCNASNVAYSITAVSGATGYIWTVPAGATIVSGQNTTSILVNYGSFTSGTVSVKASNTCGNSQVRSLSVKSKPATVVVSGNNSVCAGSIGEVYSLTGQAGVTYTWSVPVGATIASGQGTSSITVDFGANSGNVSVIASNGCGANTAVNFSVNVTSCSRIIYGSNDVQNSPFNFSMNPNPARDNVTLTITSATITTCDLLITDIIGHSVMNTTLELNSGETIQRLNVETLKSGLYIVTMRTPLEQKSFRLEIQQ
jgi:PKD-like domain/SprB repeat/Secretion system C-terminal sorting domain